MFCVKREKFYILFQYLKKDQILVTGRFLGASLTPMKYSQIIIHVSENLVMLQCHTNQ